MSNLTRAQRKYFINIFPERIRLVTSIRWASLFPIVYFISTIEILLLIAYAFDGVYIPLVAQFFSIGPILALGSYQKFNWQISYCLMKSCWPSIGRLTRAILFIFAPFVISTGIVLILHIFLYVYANIRWGRMDMNELQEDPVVKENESLGGYR